MSTGATISHIADASLGNKGIVITVDVDGEILGHLMIGKASVVWFEKNAKKKGHKISWNDFRAWVRGKPESKATRP